MTEPKSTPTPLPESAPDDTRPAPASPPARPSKRWDWRPTFRWFAAEFLVVVSGVLVALALNAWWGNWQEAKAATALRFELDREIKQTRDVIAAERAWSGGLMDKARTALTAMASGEQGAGRDSALALTGSVFVIRPFSPANDTYTEALGSGRLNLLTDSDLRIALSRYQSQIDGVALVERAIFTQFFETLEPFTVANTVYSEIANVAWRDDLVAAPFATDFDALAANPVLWNLLTIRLEMEVAREAYLAELDRRANIALLALDR